MTTTSSQTEAVNQQETKTALWNESLYCMGCGYKVQRGGIDDPIEIDELEFDPFSYMCLDCYDKVKELRRSV